MARGMNNSGLLQYVTAFLRLCQQRECHCTDETPCGFHHFPCGFYGPKDDDGSRDLPKSQQHFACYCPRVLPDGERLLVMVIAQHGGEIFYKLDNIAEMVARSHRQVTRLIAALERRTIVKSLTCKQAHCTAHHRSRHIRLSLQLPGMPAFEDMERGYMNLARAKVEGQK